MITRRLLLAAGASLAAPALRAEDWPTRPIRVIVPYAAGGADTFIRPLQPRLVQELGQPMIIDSVTGAGGAVGVQRVKAAPPDGYTLLFCGTGALTAVPRLQKLSYSIADFAPIANLVAIPYIMAARPGLGVRDIPGLLALARSRPDGLTYGTPGIGSTPHLVTEAMAKATGIKMTHIPYSGVATAVIGLLANDIDLVVGAPANVVPLTERGIVLLAQTGARRISPLPNLPTLRENGIDAEMVTRFGFLAPASTPAAIVEKLGRLLLQGGADPEYAAGMNRNYNEVELLPAARFREFLAEEDRVTARLLEDLKIE